ncbi:MAG: trimethylamine methyltransferase family protein, partial [Firmicutes bacterium]|nr:trimethylamine methyltransferase family protein [Bacillota bacterium]
MGKHFYIILLVFNRKDNIMNHRIQKIHEASIKILSKTGMKYHHPKAVEILKENGIAFKDNIAFFTEKELMQWIKKAPSEIRLYAENPDHNIIFGKGESQIAPPYGCPSVTQKDGTVRPGTISDYIDMLKLFQVNKDFHINGGLLIQPNDIDIQTSALFMFYASLIHSDKVLMVPTGPKEQMNAIMESMAVLCGGHNKLKKEPRLCTIVNINTPLQLDVSMTDALMIFAENGQPFAATNGAMAGSTSPMTLAGTIAMFNAEILATIALAQMINPGTPVFY